MMSIAASSATPAVFEALKARPDLALASAEILWRAGRAERAQDFLTDSATRILAFSGAETLAIAVPEAGRWATIARAGQSKNVPTDVLGEVLDRGAAVQGAVWSAAPLDPKARVTEVLAVSYGAKQPPARHLEMLEALASTLAAGLSSVRAREQGRKRIARLEAILEIASQWNQTNEMVPLLVQMAEAATRLLKADRASIFLWDRPNHQLVGRPALGVAGGELRIPDNQGLVGQVIQSGESRRVHAAGDTSVINRQVDKSLGYQTRTLLCVPLRGSRGELFGAFELINKIEGNFNDEDEEALVELASHASIALENTQQLQQLLATHRHIIEQQAQGVQLVGQSPPIEALRSTIRRVANTELAILILGENGTGKEVVSQSVHYLSPRREQPFIAVNCAAISETLLESELFGHEKGAFTDAHESRQGKFELASGGTLFLDEIGDLSLGGQAKLLRVLEEKVVVRVGGSKPIHTDARVIAATNQNLAEMVRAKRFRQDLFFRLNVVSLELPPLRDRDGDIMMLAKHFLVDFCRKAHRKPLEFSHAAVKRMEGHSWPGNVRELRNLMERLAYLSASDTIEAEDLAFILAPAGEGPAFVSPDLPLTEATDKFQIEYIKKAIQRCKNNMSDAAERLGLHRSNLYRKMRQLGMPTGEGGAG